jgi:predicted PurR-regulated permease PerM
MIFGRGRKSQQPTNPQRDVPVGSTRKHEVESAIPMGVEIAGQWAWRLLAVAAGLALFGFVVAQLKDIVVPLLVAILVASLLVPLVNFLVRHRWPRGLAVALAMVLTLGIVSGLIVLVVTQIRAGSSGLAERSVAAFDDFKEFLAASPLAINETDLTSLVDQGIKSLQEDSGVLVTGALSVGTTAGHLLTGFLLVLFSTLFILIDGKGIFAWVVRLFPRKARPALHGAGQAGWVTLTTFVKVQIFVAFVDAVGIGLGAWIIGLFYDGFPLVIPIAIVVFLASFIPVVGAVFSGAIAVLVALVYLDPFAALLMLGVVLLVQQIEGHVLQPLVMGAAVKVHPLAVVMAVAAASFIAGIPGALFAVPFIAVLNVMVKYISSGAWRTEPHPSIKDVSRASDVVDSHD